MFVGHYAVAFALKDEKRSRLPLWALFLAAQAVDVLYFLLVLLGIERLRIDPEAPPLLRTVLEWLPYSHSLAMALVYGALCVVAGRLLGRTRDGLVIGVAVASHWFLDLVMHTPDLPLWIGDESRFGLGLWYYPVAAYVLEVALLGAGFGLLAKRHAVGAKAIALFLVLVATQAFANFLMPVPKSVEEVAWSALLMYPLFALLAWALVDRGITRARGGAARS